MARIEETGSGIQISVHLPCISSDRPGNTIQYFIPVDLASLGFAASASSATAQVAGWAFDWSESLLTPISVELSVCSTSYGSAFEFQRFSL